MAFSPLINGRRFSFTSIELAFTTIGKPFSIYNDVNDVSYSEALEIELMRGTSRGPIGWTAGTYSPGEASFAIGKSSAQGLIQSIGPGWLGINLNAIISYSDIGEPLVVDTLVGRITGMEDAYSYGPSPLYSKLTMQLFTILRNGVPPLLNRVL